MHAVQTIEAILNPRDERPKLEAMKRRMIGRMVMSHTCQARSKWFKGRKNRDQRGRLLLKYMEEPKEGGISDRSIEAVVEEGRAQLAFHTGDIAPVYLNVIAFNGGRDNTTIERFKMPQPGMDGEVTTSIEQMDFKQAAAFMWLLQYSVPDWQKLKESRQPSEKSPHRGIGRKSA